MELENKIALVTGSSRGIGKAIALRLARSGADVAINFFRNRAAAEQTANEVRALGRKAYVIKAHVGDEAKVATLFSSLQEQAGGLDILVCNAASGFLRPVLEQDTRGWDWTLDVNARALLLCAQHAVPLMAARGGGKIVGISSLGSQRALPNYVAVGVSKAAVETLTRYLAVELAAQNIAVNAVSGGIVETEALDHFPNREQMLEIGLNKVPAGRMLQADDLAEVVAFLCSPGAHMIRGQTIIVDGGYSLMP